MRVVFCYNSGMYSSWAERKRRWIKLSIWTIVIVTLGTYLGVRLYRPPSCFDQKKNQNEVGVDCGGVCSILCTTQVQDMNTLWARTFEVSHGMWSALAYVENPNFTAYAQNVPYRFTLYDKDGATILERTNTTFISGEPALPIFEGRLNVGDRIPYRVTFEWLGKPVWYRLDTKHTVTLQEQKVTPSGTGVDVTATMVNKEAFLMQNIEVTAIVYDTNQNAIAASETFVDLIKPREQRQLVFSWPKPFPVAIGRVELVPRIPLQEE
jgi:hypothetical protein